MPSSLLPPGCGRLPGEEPEEPAYWSLGELVARQLKRDHSDWKERGNRDDYIASDCWKDADLDCISSGIISVRGDDNGLVVKWGWHATFCSGDARAADGAEACVQGASIPGNWDCDCDSEPSWSVSGTDEFHVNLHDEIEPDCLGLRGAVYGAKAVWERFLKEREPLEEEAALLHDMLEQNYKEATAGATEDP